ncbi:elongator complex protein 5 [Pararge aegeria]|uniref:Elongator complex protein 5 n=2 Tax=Pararge aegeria TaxID=116150 RepID=A0A8S4S866_9NEOP|nr:elongator complex protein 5 [Pararge aegeria]CAH2259759.1 jg24329 [Pararge aegeria aegeria]
MTLFKLKAASCVLIEDDCDKNVLPLISELVEKSSLNILCYEQPICVWQNIYSGNSLQCFKDSQLKEWQNSSAVKTVHMIDSVNQMILDVGWDNCLTCLRNLLSTPEVVKLILILHRDCLTNSKIRIQLTHLANAIVSYDKIKSNKIRVQIKKGGKLCKSEEIISYNALTSTLNLTPIVKDIVSVDEPEKVLPNELSTFKIEIDQIQQLEKNKLKLPYMSKINEGKGKVYYEPDAVDDWDDEDPDDDLDI